MSVSNSFDDEIVKLEPPITRSPGYLGPPIVDDCLYNKNCVPTVSDLPPFIQCLWGNSFTDQNGNQHCQSLMCQQGDQHVWHEDATESCVPMLGPPPPADIALDPSLYPVDWTGGGTPSPTPPSPTPTGGGGIFGGMVDASGNIFGFPPIYVIGAALAGFFLYSSMNGGHHR